MNDCAVKELQLKLCPPNRRVKKRKAQDKYASLADDGRESCNTALHINATCSEAKIKWIPPVGEVTPTLAYALPVTSSGALQT
jgi:hypothetical protein